LENINTAERNCFVLGTEMNPCLMWI